MLSAKQLKDVCLLQDNTHKKCRYLSHDENDASKYYCMKKSSRANEINTEVDEFVRETKKKGKDPKKQNLPLGDNCQGYPILRNIEQGYDKGS
jgi:hypothetical protein